MLDVADYSRDTGGLDDLPPDGAHGAVLAERLRFGPPETWRGWRRGAGVVAVKLFPAGMAMPAQLPAKAAFRHPGVAPLLDWGDGWMVFGWIAGSPLPPATPAPVSVVEAVAALHRAGLHHGDLKPAHIIMAERAVLIDWGEDCAGTPGWRPDFPHTPRQRDEFALARLARGDVTASPPAASTP